MRYGVLGQLQKPGGRVECGIDAPAPPGTGVDLAGNVVGRIELSNAGTSVVARGHVMGEAVLDCSRCLEQFRWPFRVDFTEDCCLRQIDDPTEYEVAQDEDEPTPILDEDVVDLSELVRQLIVVEMPLRPLCRLDCAGLCPRCGTDLNDEPCNCDRDHADPRWAKLKEMLEE